MTRFIIITHDDNVTDFWEDVLSTGIINSNDNEEGIVIKIDEIIAYNE